MKWLFPIVLLITFEFIADIFAKQYSLDRRISLALAALASYVIANTFWLFALREGVGLARGSVIFSVLTGIFAVIVGVFFYKERVTSLEWIGLVLGLLAMVCLFWNE